MKMGCRNRGEKKSETQKEEDVKGGQKRERGKDNRINGERYRRSNKLKYRGIEREQ